MKKVRILSLDGGGIRGIIPGVILAALEKELKVKSGREDASISEYVDLVAGTSTGGILAGALLVPDEHDDSKPRYSASEAVNIYLNRGDEIFKTPLWKKVQSKAGVTDEKYPAKELEEALSDYFGNTPLSKLLKPVLISSYDIRNANPFFFKSHKARSDLNYNFELKDVARATSAAPTYFECARVKSFKNETFALIDGGVFVNNPSLCAYSEARAMTFGQLKGDDHPKAGENPTAKDMLIISFGTASSTDYHSYDEAKDWGMIGWIKPLIGIMMSGVSETVDYQLKQIFDTTDTPDHYIRIEPDLFDADSSMDNGKPDNLQRLKESGERNAERFEDEIKRIAQLLIDNH
ncbi:MAG: patatin-like phospholipase family protein [Bacteroidota bacterium]